MFFLKSTSCDGEHFLPCNRDIVIGRKDADIVITGDSSVSRKHGTIRVEHSQTNLKNPGVVPAVTVSDSSRFGTYIARDGRELTRVDQTGMASPGDLVRFGAQHSTFKLTRRPFVVATSMMEGGLKKEVQEALLRLGGHVISNWHEKVTHLVIEKIKLNVKVTQALVSACYIVTPDYVWETEKALNSGNTLPEPENYMPELEESNLSKEFCTFKIDIKRKKVFENRLFIFTNKQQYKRLSQVISSGGGRNLLASDVQATDSTVCDPKTAVVGCENTTQDDLVVDGARYEHLQEILLLADRRMIQDHEVGLAVLYCDASVYCNPGFDLNSQNAFTQRPVGSNAERTQGVFVQSCNLMGEEGQTILKKRSRTPDEDLASSKLPRKSERSLDLEEKNNDPDRLMEPREMKPFVERAENPSSSVPDSFLDDDNLWSQNFESVSFIRQEDNPLRPRKNEKEDIKNKEINPFLAQESQEQNSECDKIVIREDELVKSEPMSPQPFPDDSGHERAADIFSGPSRDHSATNNYDPSLPTCLAAVNFISLVTRRKKVSNRPTLTGIKNFKRFRKTWPTYLAKQMATTNYQSSHPPLPKIIGGSDFFVHEDKKVKCHDIGGWFGDESHGSVPFTRM